MSQERATLSSWSGITVGRSILFALSLVPLLQFSELVYPYVTTKALFFQVSVGVGLAVLLWLVGSRTTRLLDVKDPILWALVAFTAIAGFSSLLGSSPHYSFFGSYERMWGVVQWMALTLFYVLLRSFFRKKDWRVFLRCTVNVAAAVAVLAGIEYILERGVPGVVDPAIISTLGNPGYLGGFMVLSAGGALLVANQVDAGWKWLVAGAYLSLFVGALVVSENRSSMAGFMAGAVIVTTVVVLRRAREATVEGKRLLGGGIAVAGAVGVMVLAPESPTALLSALESQSLLARFEAWKAGLEGVGARPLTGWGEENFALAYDRFVDPSAYRLLRVKFDRAHNVLLGKLVQVGPLGLLAYLTFWTVIIGSVLKEWWQDHIGTVEATGLLVAFIGYFVYLQMWFEDHSSAAVLIGLAAYTRYRSAGVPLIEFDFKQDGQRSNVANGLTLVWATVSIVVVTTCVWIGAKSALTAHYVQQATTSVSLAERVDYYRKATELKSPHQRSAALRYATEMANLALAAEGILRRSDSLRRHFRLGVERAEEALNVATARSPISGRLNAAHARLATGVGVIYREEAIQRTARESWESAIAKSPPLLEYRHSMARTYALFGDSAAAQESLREALEIYDGYGRTYYLLAQFDPRGIVSPAVGRLREAFWLGYFPDDRSSIRGVVDRLLRTGRPQEANHLLSVYFASRYLPSLRVVLDPFRDDRKDFFAGLGADVARPGSGYRSYEIGQEDLTLLAQWPRAAMAAGECRDATLAMRLMLNGLTQERETARLRPMLSRQSAKLWERCRSEQTSASLPVSSVDRVVPATVAQGDRDEADAR